MSEEDRLSKKERTELKRREKDVKKADEAKKELMKKIGIAAILIVAVIFLAVFVKSGKKSASEIIDQSADPSIGPEDAVVLIKEYSDFQCPACQAAAPVIKSIIEQYGDKVRFEYNDFPLPQHTRASDAAVGAQCAFEQDRFFDYHDLLFESQEEWGALSEQKALDMFTGFAEELDLDMTAFGDCVVKDEIADRVNEDVTEGRALNVNSTPTFFVNDERISTTPFSIGLGAAIEAALGERGPVTEALEQAAEQGADFSNEETEEETEKDTEEDDS